MSKLHSISLTTANAKSASSAPIAGRAAKSIRQFSDCYDLCKASVYIEIRDGRLTACKIRNKTVILPEDEDNWVKNLPRVKSRKPAARHTLRAVS